MVQLRPLFKIHCYLLLILLIVDITLSSWTFVRFDSSQEGNTYYLSVNVRKLVGCFILLYIELSKGVGDY